MIDGVLLDGLRKLNEALKENLAQDLSRIDALIGKMRELKKKISKRQKI